MRSRALRIAAFFLVGLGSFATGTPPVHAEDPSGAKAIPPAPYYYVLDEPQVLPTAALQAVQKLLVEHDHATGEQVVIAIFKSLGNEDPVTYTNRVFSTWGIGQRGKDNGVLLALYWAEHKARIEVGYGLEQVLTDAKSRDVIDESLVPELKNGDPGRAISLAAMQILTILGSPLIENGEAQGILRGGGFNGAWHARPHAVVASVNGGGSWAPWLFLGIVLLIIVLNLVTAGDAHFTSAGWYRPSPFQRRRWGGGLRSGGVGGFFGGWGGGGGGWGGGGGDGGGFSGGGGSSGGGGASGSW